MIIESINENQIRAVLDREDLMEFGFEGVEIFQNPMIIETLFHTILTQAEQEHGFKANGPLYVEFKGEPQNGAEIIMTIPESDIFELEDEEYECNCPRCRYMRGEDEYGNPIMDSDDFEPEEYVTKPLTFKFRDFEHIISVSHNLKDLGLDDTSVYHYQHNYYFVIEGLDVNSDYFDDFKAILAEYGQEAKITTAVLAEYGKTICNKGAIEEITTHFELRG